MFSLQLKESAAKHEEYAPLFEKLNEFIEIKDKYGEATFPTCIEQEIYPHIEDKILKKINKDIDRKLAPLSDKYVAHKVFEAKNEQMKGALTE